jgi:hypothetical protein
VYEKLRESERARQKLQARLGSAQQELSAAATRASGSGGAVEGEGEKGSAGSNGGGSGTPLGSGVGAVRWKGGRDRDDADAGDADKIPVYVTTLLVVGALLYFYDVPEVGKRGEVRVFKYMHLTFSSSCGRAGVHS